MTSNVLACVGVLNVLVHLGLVELLILYMGFAFLSISKSIKVGAKVRSRITICLIRRMVYQSVYLLFGFRRKKHALFLIGLDRFAMLFFIRWLLSPLGGFLDHDPIFKFSIITISPARQEFEQRIRFRVSPINRLIYFGSIWELYIASILAWHEYRPELDTVALPHRFSSLIRLFPICDLELGIHLCEC